MVESIDTLLKDKQAQSCVMSPPTNLQTWYNILRQLGTPYVGNSVEAFKEYITNAADAGARNIEVTIERKGKHKKIKIFDDGKGMFLPSHEEKYVGLDMLSLENVEIEKNSILRLPKSVGDSAKRFDSSMQGKKAIGALAWQSFCDRVAFVSKVQGYKPVAWTCTYSKQVKTENGKKLEEFNFDSSVIQLDRNEVSYKQGTEVIFDNLSASVLQELTGKRLRDEIGSKFSKLLRQGVNISIRDGKEVFVVQPEKYTGNRITLIPERTDERVDTKFGPIFFDLYETNTGNGVVHVKQGIQTLLEDISKRKNLLGTDAWGSGIIQGEITADWLEPAAGRQDVEMDEKAEVFYDVLRKYRKDIEAIVKLNKQKFNPKENTNFENVLKRTWNALIQQYPEYADYLLGYKTSKTGNPIPGKPEAGPTPPEVPVKGPRKKPSPGGPRTPGTPIDPHEEGETKGRKAVSLRFDQRNLGPNRLSLFERDQGQNTMVYNNEHQNYIRASKDPLRKKMYMTGLLGKEVLSPIYKDAQELADQVIVFQQRFLTLFPL